MGYRSEVAISVLEKDFNKFISELDKEKDKDVIELLEYGNIRKVGKIITIHWDDVKWYEGYNDIDKIMGWLDELANEGSVAKFVRIGEDYDDMEVKEYYNDYDDDAIAVVESIYSVRYISVPENYEEVNINNIKEGVDNND